MEKIEQTSLTSAQESAQAEEQVNKSEKKTFWKTIGVFLISWGLTIKKRFYLTRLSQQAVDLVATDG